MTFRLRTRSIHVSRLYPRERKRRGWRALTWCDRWTHDGVSYVGVSTPWFLLEYYAGERE